MIVSGAVGNLIDLAFAQSHGVPLLTNDAQVAVTTQNGRPLGSGQILFLTQDISRLIGSPSQVPPPLRHWVPSLSHHPRSILAGEVRPHFNLSGHRLIFASAHCQRHCLQTTGRSENYSVKPDCSYHPYRDQRDREVEGVAGSIRGFAGGLQQPTCHTTVPSTSCPEQCPHKDECSRFPSLSQKPCRPTSKKSWQRALSDLLHPQLRL